MYKESAKQQININEMLAFNCCLFGKLFSPFPFAVRSDSVRRPIRFRPPPDRIPFAVWSDSVRRPIGFRSPPDRIPFGWRWLFVRFYCENIKDYCCLFYRIAIVFNVQTVVFVVMKSTDLVRRNEQRINRIKRILYSMKKIRSIRLIRCFCIIF